MLTEDEAIGPNAGKQQAGKLQPLPLDTLGIAELRSYVEALRDEITRVEAVIASKRDHLSTADAFFKKG